MSRTKTLVATTAAIQPKTHGRLQPSVNVFQCLVVSASQSRREMLMNAATQSGWDTVVCADSENAINEVRRTKFRFALIDLDGHGGLAPSGFRQLSEQLATDKVLLAVCGHEGDAREEIWARQLGAWLYLPGVIEGDDLGSLCNQAREVVAQMLGLNKATATRKASV